MPAFGWSALRLSLGCPRLPYHWGGRRVRGARVVAHQAPRRVTRHRQPTRFPSSFRDLMVTLFELRTIVQGRNQPDW